MGKNTPLYHSENYRSKNKNANFLKLPYTEYCKFIVWVTLTTCISVWFDCYWAVSFCRDRRFHILQHDRQSMPSLQTLIIHKI